MSFRRAHSNYVNLGRLYSIPPWGSVPPYGQARPQANSVNLGNLYFRSQTKYPPGWAYFEDGSVLILPLGWCSHDALEARMNAIAHFVRNPTPKMQQIRATRPPMKRFIIIDKNGNDIRENMLRILARNAQDGQRVSVVEPPFENVELSLNSTGAHPVSARFSDAPQLRYEYRLRNSQALKTFRGTLVDGVLQPNVRVGNGLRLSNKPEILKPQITEKRRARNREANKRREGADSVSKIHAKSPRQSNMLSSREGASCGRPDNALPLPQKSPRDLDLERREAQVARRERKLMQFQQQLLRTMQAQSMQPYQGKRRNAQVQQPQESSVTSAKTKPDSKTVDIEVRKQALKQQEELLRYKRKTWLLEQKLAHVTARSPPRRRLSNTETDMQERNTDIYEEIGSDHEFILDSFYTDSEGVQRSEYSLDNISPPAALENLRSRTPLPRKMTRSNQERGYR